MAVKIEHKDVLDYVQPQATFTVASVNTDPTNLTVKQQDADGVETTLLNNVLVSTLNGSSTPVAKTATGIFKLNPGVQLTKEGYWFFLFTGTGAAAASEETQYIVDPSEFSNSAGLSTRALVNLPETKDWLQVQNVETGNDLELARVINDASDRMHYEAAREFKALGTNPAVRLFDVDALAVNRRQVFIGDLASAPTLVRILDKDGAAVATVTSGDYMLLPRVREPWEPIQRIQFSTDVTKLVYGETVEVTGTWGFPLIPGNVRQAVLDTVAAIMDRDVEHYSQGTGFQGQNPQGSTIVMAYGAQRILSLPPSAQAVAWAYRRTQVG